MVAVENGLVVKVDFDIASAHLVQTVEALGPVLLEVVEVPPSVLDALSESRRYLLEQRHNLHVLPESKPAEPHLVHPVDVEV